MYTRLQEKGGIMLRYTPVILSMLYASICVSKPAHVTLLIVLDQLSYHTFYQQAPYYQYALKTLADHGVTFSECYHPHANPKTAVGHATLATGSSARYHGITDNSWKRPDGSTQICDVTTHENAAVFDPYGTTYGTHKGPEHLWLDTIFDQIALHRNDTICMTIAGKSRAAIHFSGHHGHALWMDYTSGGFTSSQFYYTELPQWIQTFNAQHRLATDTDISWDPVYHPDHSAYTTPITPYPGTPNTPSFNARHTISSEKDDAFKDYLSSPAGQRRIIECAQHSLDNMMRKHPNSHIIMCLSLSSLDYVGHYHGPESRAYRDMIYHADRDLQTLFTWLYQQVPAHDVMTIFTSDHGSMPIPEQMERNGMPFAQRISGQSLIDELNNDIATQFGVSDLITSHSQPWLHIDEQRYRSLDRATQSAISQRIISHMREKDYIIDAYDVDNLAYQQTTEREQPRLLYNQAAPDRVGRFMYLIRPYCSITDYKHGTTHASPYAYDTHVPLIVYQPGVYEKSEISEYTTAMQIAPTLARMYHVPRPSGATSPPLTLTHTQPHQ